MKSKKKFLLLGVGAMGALALAVGATSTFAWLQATTTVGLTSTDNGANITATATEVTLSDVGMTIRIDKVGTAVELSHFDGTDVKYGGVPQGIVGEMQTGDWDGDQSKHKLIGEYGVSSLTWTSGAPSPATINSLKGYHYEFELKAKGNAVILDSASLTLDTAAATSGMVTAAKSVATSAKVTLTFASNWDGTIPNVGIAIDKPYYMIRTNNPYGLDYTNFDSAVAYGATVATGAIAAETLVSNSTNYYVVTSEIAQNTEFANAGDKLMQVWLHTDNKIAVTAATANPIQNT